MSKIAFVFPGQGAQYTGMAKDFYEKYAVSREVFESASKASGLDVKALCFEENDRLNITEYTQIAMLTAEIAMLRALEERGINTKYVRVDRHEQTGLAVITVEKDGTNRIIVYPGANDKINLGDLEAAFTCYPDAVLVQFEINRDTVISAARLAADESIPLIVDAGPATPDFPLEKLERVEILTPNETETEILTGIRPNSLENCLRASMALCSRVPTKYVVLKLGGRGCYVYDGKYCDIISPFDTNVVDTTAAGDIFTAALAAEYLRSGDIIASARFANAAGALAVSKRGSMNSVPALAQVNELLANG